jgi:uncharacterized membrane protein
MRGYQRAGTVATAAVTALASSPAVAWANAMLPPGGLARGLANDYGTSMIMLALAIVALPFAVAAFILLRRMARGGPAAQAPSAEPSHQESRS